MWTLSDERQSCIWGMIPEVPVGLRSQFRISHHPPPLGLKLHWASNDERWSLGNVPATYREANVFLIAKYSQYLYTCNAKSSCQAWSNMYSRQCIDTRIKTLYYMNVNLNLHQLYTTATGKVAISYVSYIHYHICTHTCGGCSLPRPSPVYKREGTQWWLACTIKSRRELN